MNIAPSPHDVTRLLVAWSHGDQAALDQLVQLVYDELHRKAHYYMRQERPDHSLQTTALVNEVYVRLVDSKSVTFNDRAHFLAVCAKTMRRILVDHARARQQQKRGGEYQKVALDEALMVPQQTDSIDLAVLDDVLERLAEFAPRKAQVVEMRYFGGLTVKETATALGVSEDTVMDDWKFAKAWLLKELSNE
ncbi:MAG TPA: sigma-70 family RNA polymerase sigma factor [Blastocatellia bacterium]|nr:sigma-70 family RNA polymerase sigma factor [Blastocatellia bacterium]